ncbi:unnamed protein product [Paramecium pentaurelia]|uniref:Uncharacterized protein n=1 Tax=Paramecium pentaurelia TaxID=43138 RepID=A0A8S1XM19_9CILI|nr:unnamed protein product [Paramecium pentaurelia]
MFKELRSLINETSAQIPKKNIAQVQKHNQLRQMNLLQKKICAPSIQYSMFQSDFGTFEYQIVPQESSDSESIISSSSQYPSLHFVASLIFLNAQYSQIPCSTVLKDSLISKLIVKNIDKNIDLVKVQEFIDTLPINGFVLEFKLIYYQSNPCIIFYLKTDQPLIVFNQFVNKSNSKIAKSIFGYKFTCAQLTKIPQEFAAVIIRGLDDNLNGSQIEKIICYTLNMKQKECIIESSKIIIKIENVGCMVFVLKDLEYCERVVVSLNGTNLNGLQKNKILVNVHPESVKIRKVDHECSIQKGLLQKYIKINEKNMK